MISLGRGIDRERIGEQNPHSVFDSLIAQLTDLRVLVLLLAIDAVPSSWLDLLLRSFASLPQVRVIATSQSRPNVATQVYTLPVPPLSDAEAVALTRDYAAVFNVDVDPEELVKLLPASVRSHPQALLTLLAHLRDIPLDLLLLEGIPEDARAPVRLVEQMISLLSDHEREALAVTELLAEVEMAKALRALGLDPPQSFLRSIQVLLSRSLIHRLGAAYTVPAIVSEAFGTAAPEVRSAAALSVAQSLQRALGSLTDAADYLGVLATIGARVALRFREQGRWDLVRELTGEKYLELLNSRGYWKEYSLLLRVGIEGTANAGDGASGFRLRCRLARKLLQMGATAEARTLLEEVESYQGAGGDQLDRAEAHSHRALLYTMDRKDEAALKELDESRRIRESAGDSQGLAVTESLAGGIYLGRREYARARQAYRAALAHLGGEESRYAVDVQTALALCDYGEGLPEEAEALLRQTLDRCRRLNYHAALPRVLYHLATVVESRGQFAEAATIARDAAEKAKANNQRIMVAAHLLAQRLETMSALVKKEESHE